MATDSSKRRSLVMLWHLCSTLALGTVRVSGARAASTLRQSAFGSHVFLGSDGIRMPYRLYRPASGRPDSPTPLIIHLHGAGGLGTDNELQMAGGNAFALSRWSEPALQQVHAAYVLAPQIAGSERWANASTDALSPAARRTLELLEALSTQLPIDRDRVYLTGTSLGGQGVWDIIEKTPDTFAAAIVLCGTGDPSRVTRALRPPTWVFHGAQDPSMPVRSARAMVTALRKAGGRVRYSEYPAAGHDVWTFAYREKELPDWLFSQRRNPLPARAESP